MGETTLTEITEGRRWSAYKFRQVFQKYEQSGGTMASMARDLGYHASRVYGWVKKGRTPRKSEWPAIADYLEVHLHSLTAVDR